MDSPAELGCLPCSARLPVHCTWLFLKQDHKILKKEEAAKGGTKAEKTPGLSHSPSAQNIPAAEHPIMLRHRKVGHFP